MHTAPRPIAMRAGVLALTFALGYAAGSLTTPPADAGLGDMIKDAASSGKLGPIGDLGSSIVEMQEHVDALQKNLETLRRVKSALGG